jgi:uncharacterized membrane protein YeaQ/YmgE (transglycosylase-associated protein family)
MLLNTLFVVRKWGLSRLAYLTTHQEIDMIGAVIGWAILGLIAGGLARLLHPGRDAMGIFATICLGVLGSILGGALAYVLRLGTTPYEPGGWILATIGAIVLLAFGWFGTRRTASTL